MNETDFIRQQLAAERTHLSDILQAVRQGPGAAHPARPVALYIEWASQRLLHQVAAHCAALPAAPASDPQIQARLTELSRVAARLAEPEKPPRALQVEAESVLALLQALGPLEDSLNGQIGGTLRISHWRQVAQLNADTILEERQRYAAARLAAGLA